VIKIYVIVMYLKIIVAWVHGEYIVHCSFLLLACQLNILYNSCSSYYCHSVFYLRNIFQAL
jgi:hypothetical protein